MDKKLGKLKNVRFGWGGYDGCQFGLSLMIEGDAWEVGDFRGAWGIDRPENAKWTEDDRRNDLVDVALFLRDTLKAAKKMHVEELNGVPVEAMFDGQRLKSWRVLTEVL